MNHRPLVTVYITNHNYGRYIKKAIESVLKQTLQDFELLIIDDGSTDNSREIIEAYSRHEKISIVYQKNQGLNYSNNIAMRAAKGTYLMRLDADDFLAPEAIETMSRILETDPELGLVFPDYYYVDVEGHVTGREQRFNFKQDVSIYDKPAHGACTMIRLEYLKKIGGYSEGFTCQDGYDLWIKFIHQYKVENVNTPLFYYRKHGTNLTNNEEKILTTRQKINDWFVHTQSLRSPSTVVILPLRSTRVGETIWPLYRGSDGKTVVETLVEKIVFSKKIDSFVIVSENQDILNEAKNIATRFNKVRVLSRPMEYARLNETLEQTVFHVLAILKKEGNEPESVLLLSAEYPFINKETVEDALNALTIFKADSLLSLRPDTKTYYRHTGHGMVPIVDQEKTTKLEREALYRREGGIILSTIENLYRNERLVSGRVGHILIDRKTAFGVFDEFDFQMFKTISL